VKFSFPSSPYGNAAGVQGREKIPVVWPGLLKLNL